MSQPNSFHYILKRLQEVTLDEHCNQQPATCIKHMLLDPASLKSCLQTLMYELDAFTLNSFSTCCHHDAHEDTTHDDSCYQEHHEETEEHNTSDDHNNHGDQPPSDGNYSFVFQYGDDEKFVPNEYQQAEEHNDEECETDPFTDPYFPPDDSSIWGDKHNDDSLGEVIWLRPHQMEKVTHPQLFSSGAEVQDAKQGSLGDCAVISAICVVSARHMRTWWDRIYVEHESFHWQVLFQVV